MMQDVVAINNQGGFSSGQRVISQGGKTTTSTSGTTSANTSGKGGNSGAEHKKKHCIIF